MTFLRKPFLASIVLTAVIFSVSYGINGYWNLVPLIVAIGLFWWLAGLRNLGWMAWPGLAGYVITAASGVFLGLPFISMLAGVISALVAWDLNRFEQRMKYVNRDESTLALEHQHLKRLLLTCGSGLALSLAALSIQIQYSFGAAVVLSLLLAFSLSRMIGHLRSKSE